MCSRDTFNPGIHAFRLNVSHTGTFDIQKEREKAKSEKIILAYGLIFSR